MADTSTHPQADVINTSSSVEENVNPEMKKRKTHRLKQRFQVVRKLGQGTYGKVQLAINNETGQEVAIKTIKKSKVENSQDLIRIRREIQIMSSIHHPHIIHIYEVFENKDKIVLVMQYASGGELYDYVSYHKVLSDSDARRLFRQIATAIYYCHKNKICHRDLKLENILLDEKGNAKIADFGLSNVFDEKHFLQTFCGSPLYASPEIVRGLPYFGPEVDCWSLGVLLYTLVYGAMPFDGSNFKKLVKQISESSYYEPPNKSAGSDLIRKLLMPNPRDRATIIDICTDEWVNQDFEHSLLQVAEDLANLTPVRCDMLLALAPTSPKVDANDKAKEEVAAGEGATPSEQSDEVQSNKVAESNKRTVDNTSFSASTTKMDETKKSKKKTKRTEGDSATLPKDQTIEQTSDLPQEPLKESPPPVPSEPQESKETFSGKSTADASLAPNEKSVEPAFEPTDEANLETTEKQVSPSESCVSKVSNASSSSMTSPKRPGRLSIPKIWDSASQDTAASPVEDVKKALFIPVGLKVSEAKKVIERRCSVDSGSQLKRRDSLSSASELNKDQKVREVKKYTGRSLSLNLQEASKTKRETANQTVQQTLPPESTVETKDESESPYQSKPSTPISEEDKSLAKQIIRKNIARAKLMEKQQVSVNSESGETTPLVSIENSNVSIIQNTPTGKVMEAAGKTSGGLISGEASFNPSPITRSYKKVTFTKDGACIKESGKFYSHEGKDGYTTRVEKKSMVTHIINNDGNSNNVVNIQRSDSQSSSGSTDIFDDIFDDHWTGDVFSNVKSLFNNIFENSSRRFNERTSLRSRAESLERSTNDWFTRNRKSAFSTKEDDSPASSSIFDSQRSMMTSMSKFSSSFKSSFDKRFDDLMSPLSTRREQSKISYPNLPKFGSRFSRESSLHRENDSFDSRLGGGVGADEQNRQDSTRRRVEQWLHSDDGKDLETYGTIGPKNFRRYVRTMTSNDSASNVFKRVQLSNTSEKVMEKSAASLENCESVNSNAVLKDNEIEVRFSLDNLEGTGPAVLTSKGPLKLSSDQSDSAVSTSADSGIKIAETSSLLEQLRTFGYKNLVSRRLSESSSTEDIIQSAQESSSDVNALDRPGAGSIRRETSPAGGPQHVNHSGSETSLSFRRQQSRETASTAVGEGRLRKDSDVAAPVMADSAGQEMDFKSETVQERILRKSYYSRFNEDSRSSYTCRQRRRSMTRLNEHTSEFFSSSSSSSSILSSTRPQPKSLLFYEPKSSGTVALSSLLSSGKSLADLASDISSRYSNSRGRQSSPRSTRSSDEDEVDLMARGGGGGHSKGTSRL